MQNINPEIWGSHGWKFMHYITLSYPNNPTDSDKINMVEFFSSVGKVLPCMSCRLNYIKHNNKYPLNDKALSDRKSLVEWLMNVHNEVNLLNNKPTYTLDKLYKEYMEPKVTTKCNFNYTLLGLLVLLIIILVYRKYFDKITP